MARYAVEHIWEGKQEYFLIRDHQSWQMVLLPSKYLTHLIRANRCLLYTSCCMRNAEKLLEEVGIGKEYWQRNVLQLSGGQQQRVAIARALASDAHGKSTEPISMPSSKLEVATTQRNSPRLSRSSIILRRSLETDP